MLTYKRFLLLISSVLILIPFHFIGANENTVFLYNRIESCKSSEYYDVNYFMCRECDPQLNLMPSKNGKIYRIKLQMLTHIEIPNLNRRSFHWIDL